MDFTISCILDSELSDERFDFTVKCVKKKKKWLSEYTSSSMKNDLIINSDGYFC